jgi:carbonic anhydrase
MENIFKGTIEFRKKDFEDHKHLFQELSKKQKPHTLFIACSDSRVVPSMISNTLPGEFFVVRNIANIVPTYRQTNEYLATTSAIEFAVESLNVENIIVCGHSNCGGCASLYLSDEELVKIPNTKKWLELSKSVKEKVLYLVKNDSISVREWMTEQMNIVEQIKHLLTYPYIKEKYSNDKIKIYGWYYIIETGEIFNYNQETSIFELIN